MTSEAHKIVEEMEKLRAVTVHQATIWPTHQSHLMSRLLVLLAEEQERAAAVLEKQTDRLVKFTKLLILLTVALVFVGVIQIAMMVFKP
jgi:hypothetical protein